MKKFSFIAFVLAVAVAASAATATADEVVASQQIVWGETAGDLQLGLRFDVPNHVYRSGETAQFDLIVRNVGKTPVKFDYYSPPFPVPVVTDESGKLLESALKSPPPRSFPVGLALALAPGAQTVIARTELRIGSPIVPTLFWALDAPPGKYRVGFDVQLDAPFGSKGKRAPIMLKSGFTSIEIAAN